jgi:hypothetical protein
VVRDLVGSVDDLDRALTLAERLAKRLGRPEQQAASPLRGRVGSAGCDFRQPSIGAERVYRDCWDGPSGEPPSATTWRPP